KVGFTEGIYTRSDGYQQSFADRISDSGHVLGRSTHYDGNSEAGQLVWVNNGSATIGIGSMDQDYSTQNNHTVQTSAVLPQGVLFVADRLDWNVANSDPDFFTFTGLVPGAQFSVETIDLFGNNIDTYLGWFDSTGALINTDDDGGAKLLSKLAGIV